MNTYRIHCLSTAESPITHMARTAGNEGIVATEPVLTSRGVVNIPYLSGNAIRHRVVREPGMMWLANRYELKGTLTLPQLNFLLHGGNLTGSTSTENTRRIAEMQRCWPLLRLLGGSLTNQIIAGSLDVWRGMLVCQENQDTIGCDCELRPAADFMGGYQYTRQDARKTGLAASDENGGGDSNQMIFAGQCVLRGAAFVHGFVLKHVSDVELGALLLSLRLWQHAGGTVGGQAARGHGRLKCELIQDGDGLDQAGLVAEYIAHVDAVRDDAVAWLKECFPC